MKNTAVEWLVEQLINHNGITRSAFDNVIREAKQMEKEQIVNAVYYTCSAMSHSDKPCGEEYYDITFK